MQTVENPAAPPVSTLAVTWVIQLPVLFYAVHGGFSFLHTTNGVLMTAGTAVNAMDPADSTAMRLLVLLVSLIVLLLFCPFAQSVGALLRRNIYLTCIVALALLSAMWSQDPTRTLQKSVYLGVNTCFAFYLTERFTPTRLMRLLMIAGSVAMVSSIFLGIALPRVGVLHGVSNDARGWQGIFPHKNELGIMMVFFLTPALFLPVTSGAERLRRTIYICTALLLIGLSQSRGAWIIGLSLFAFAAVIKLGRRMQRRERVATYLSLTIALSILGGIALAYSPLILDLLNKDTTLSGRTVIWDALLPSVGKRPLLGYGYAAFWLGLKGESIKVALALHWTGIHYSENGMLDLCLQLGAVGVTLFVSLYAQAYLRLRQLISFTNGTPELFWYASILFVTVVQNIESGNVATFNSLDWVLFMIAAISIGNRYRERQQAYMYPADARLPADSVYPTIVLAPEKG